MSEKKNILRSFRRNMKAAAPAFFLDEGIISYRTFDAWGAEIEQAISRAGLSDGWRVATLMPRSPLGLALFLGVSSKNVCCPLNPRLKNAEYDVFFDATGCEALVVGANSPEATAAAIRRGLVVITINQQSDLSIVIGAESTSRVHRPTVCSDGGNYALLLQTSGTTSSPKLVFLSHEQILTTVGGLRNAFNLSEQDICLNPMPFQHAHGLITAGLSSLLSGSAAVCLPSFSPEQFDEAFEKFQPTWFTGAPAMHLGLLEHYSSLGRSPSRNRLRFLRSSSAPLPPSAINRLEVLFGAPLIETYGLTETATMIATNPLPPGKRKVGSVGLACSEAEIAILADDRIAGSNVEGEIVVRGPSVIAHYGITPREDKTNFWNGWLRTGDIGKMDDDGYLFITGRSKELVKRGGLSVYPTEVDNALMALPSVSDAATFSLPHASLGEDLISVVVLAEGAAEDEQSIRTALFDRLSAYKVPSAIAIVNNIPKSESGKIARKGLAEWFQSSLRPQGVQPRNDLERSLLSAWSAAIGRYDIGVTDNVFLFGADVLKADRLQEDACREGVRLKRGAFYRFPTVSQQASLMMDAQD